MIAVRYALCPKKPIIKRERTLKRRTLKMSEKRGRKRKV